MNGTSNSAYSIRLDKEHDLFFVLWLTLYSLCYHSLRHFLLTIRRVIRLECIKFEV